MGKTGKNFLFTCFRSSSSRRGEIFFKKTSLTGSKAFTSAKAWRGWLGRVTMWKLCTFTKLSFAGKLQNHVFVWLLLFFFEREIRGLLSRIMATTALFLFLERAYEVPMMVSPFKYALLKLVILAFWTPAAWRTSVLFGADKRDFLERPRTVIWSLTRSMMVLWGLFY